MKFYLLKTDSLRCKNSAIFSWKRYGGPLQDRLRVSPVLSASPPYANNYFFEQDLYISPAAQKRCPPSSIIIL